MKNKEEIILYHPEVSIELEVRIEDDSMVNFFFVA